MFRPIAVYGKSGIVAFSLACVAWLEPSASAALGLPEPAPAPRLVSGRSGGSPDTGVLGYRPGRPLPPARPLAPSPPSASVEARDSTAGLEGAPPRAGARRRGSFRTDRPLAAASPRTVPEGSAQVEVLLIEHLRDEFDSYRLVANADSAFHSTSLVRARTTLTVTTPCAPVVRLGLSSRVEVAVGLIPSVRLRTSQPGSTTRVSSSFGGMFARLKVAQKHDTNAEATATAVLATYGYNQESGIHLFGLAVPAERRVTDYLFVRGMAGLAATSGEAIFLEGSVGALCRVAGPFSVFAEVRGSDDVASEYSSASIGGGIEWRLFENLRVDAGMSSGLTVSSPDFGFSGGLSWRP